MLTSKVNECVFESPRVDPARVWDVWARLKLLLFWIRIDIKRKYSSFIEEPNTPSISPGKAHKSVESEAISKRAKLCTLSGEVH